MKKAKINHDYTCDVCGKPAKFNVQSQWHTYIIDNDGNFEPAGDGDIDENQWYCDKHCNN